MLFYGKTILDFLTTLDSRWQHEIPLELYFYEIFFLLILIRRECDRLMWSRIDRSTLGSGMLKKYSSEWNIKRENLNNFIYFQFLVAQFSPLYSKHIFDINFQCKFGDLNEAAIYRDNVYTPNASEKMTKKKSQQINLQTHRDNMLIYMLLNDVAFNPLIRLDSPNYLNFNSKSPWESARLDRF